MEAIVKAAKNIRCLVCDLDGVFTDGLLYFGPDGEALKAFSVRDGLGIKLLIKSGIEVAVITGSTERMVGKRLASLGIQHVFTEKVNKVKTFDALLTQLGLDDQDVAYVGDDWPDLPLIQRAGLSITVPTGITEVKEQADWITTQPAGNGAIREICDLIMKAQGTLLQTLGHYGL